MPAYFLKSLVTSRHAMSMSTLLHATPLWAAFRCTNSPAVQSAKAQSPPKLALFSVHRSHLSTSSTQDKPASGKRVTLASRQPADAILPQITSFSTQAPKLRPPRVYKDDFRSIKFGGRDGRKNTSVAHDSPNPRPRRPLSSRTPVDGPTGSAPSGTRNRDKAYAIRHGIAYDSQHREPGSSSARQATDRPSSYSGKSLKYDNTKTGGADTQVSRPEEPTPQWRIQKAALKEKFPDGWAPPKRLSPEAVEGIKAMNAQYPDQFTTPVLAAHFKVSPEMIRRVLKSRWHIGAEQDEDRRQRWERRGESVWKKWVEEGKHAPLRMRQKGIGTGPRRAGQDRSLQRSRDDAVPWG